MPPKFLSLVAPCAGLALASSSLSAAALHLLPAFEESAFDYALSLADDGTVVGHSQEVETMAPVLWSLDASAYSAAQAVPLPADAVGGGLRWVSADGALLAGFAARLLTDAGDADHVPVLWSRSASGAYTATALPKLGSAASESVITSGSATGARLVGQSGATPAAVVWRGGTASGYSAQALPLPADATGASLASSMSSDGVRAVGHYETSTGTQAVAWTENNGAYTVLKLHNPAGGSRSFAEVVSRDGALAGGSAEASGALRPATWNTATGAVTVLETLPGFEATVLGIADNHVWVGGRATDIETYESAAVLWNGSGQIFDLVALASEAGFAFGGLIPESVTGIHLVSAGHYTIVGTAVTLSGETRGFVLQDFALATPAPEPEPPVVTPDPEPPVVVPEPDAVPVSRRRQSPASSVSASKTWARVEADEKPIGGGGVRPRSR